MLGGLGKQKRIHKIDAYSDYDVSIFINGTALPNWLPNFSFNLYLNNKNTGRKINVYQCLTNDFLNSDLIWSHSKCEAYNNMTIYYLNEKRIKTKIEYILKKSDDRIEKLINNLHKIQRFSIKNPQKMIYRKSLFSGFLMLNESIKNIYESIFLLNNRFVPHMKWQELDLKTLLWIPENFEKNIKEAMLIKAISEEELIRRAKAIENIYEQLISFYGTKHEELYNDINCIVNNDRQLLRKTTFDKAKEALSQNKKIDFELLKSYVNSNLFENIHEFLDGDFIL